ncbi:MAG: hypothetical protein H8E60_09685 [Candidatus Marinimicrobia bacterium]|nr:hypothetical protein [Candidatus Neomarinimicrobiota bacterium]
MTESKNVTCPHCGEKVIFKRDETGRWIGRIAGGGLGYWIASGLGIAGAFIGFPVAIAAGVLGLAVGVVVGDKIGEKIDNSNATCPKCDKGMVL